MAPTHSEDSASKVSRKRAGPPPEALLIIALFLVSLVLRIKLISKLLKQGGESKGDAMIVLFSFTPFIAYFIIALQ